MPSTLGCIGLLAPDGSDVDLAGLEALVTRILPLTEPIGVAPDGVRVRRWTDPRGARLVLELDGQGRVLGVTPSFAGTPGALLTGLVMANRDMTTAAVVDDDGEQLTALGLELEERHFLREPGAVDRAVDGAPRRFRASVVALGLDMHAFPDEAAYTASGMDRLTGASDRDNDTDADTDADTGPGWAAEAFLSHGVWGDPQTAEAYARVGGTVLDVRERVNGLTGYAFTVARVRTAGFEVDVCLPPGWPGSCRVGELLVGTAFLVGSVPELVPAAGSATDGSSPPRGRRWWRRS